MAWTEPFIYYGTSEFSQIILNGLVRAGAKPALVVSTQAEPAGRGLKSVPSPVAQAADQHKLPLVLIESFRAEIPRDLIKLKFKFAVLAAFGKIIPPTVLNFYPLGIINAHPSLLPQFRGPAPIQSAILANSQETGVSLIRLDNEIDHGPIIAQASLQIGTDDARQLANRLAQLAVELLIQEVPKYLRGEIQPIEQDHARATYTKLIKRSDGQADFSRTAMVLDLQRRAYTPWPGLWTTWQGKRLKLIKTEAVAGIKLQPGLVSKVSGQFMLGCGNKTALVLKEIQLFGGKIQSPASFQLGHASFLGSCLPS
jgi:methionyl-tRNA formyltransferase